jgi:prolycopene isomerase
VGDVRAVVVGSGIGGAALTLLLAHAKIPTVLVEKNRRLGGSCSGYEKQGFRIDIGTHMFSRGPRGPLGDVLRRVGEDGAIEFRRTHDIAEMRFVARGAGGVGPHGDVVKRVPVPSQLARMPAFAWNLARALELSPREAARAARLFTHILTMSDEEVASWDSRTIEDFCAPFTDDVATLGLFGFLLGLYFILPYWEVSAGEALFCFRRMARDNWLSYPRGGSRAIPETYCRLAEARGAEVRTGVGVRKILVREGRAAGVELTDGTRIDASVVVSTSSIRTTVMHLVGAEHFPASYVDLARRIRGSYIAVQAKIGLSKKLVSAGAIVGGVGEREDLLHASAEDLKAMVSSLEEGRIPAVVPFYCPVPTNFDETLAPPGPTTDVALKDPGPAWEEAMLRTMRRVVPDLDRHTLFVDRFSVDFIERWIGKEFGPAVSTGQTPDQVGDRRPAVSTPLPGLYLAGCNAGARGVGTELAAASAMECADAILADLGRGRRAPQARRTEDRWRERLRGRVLQPLAWATRP